MKSSWSRLRKALLLMVALAAPAGGQEMRPLPLRSSVTGVQPMTGIVLWSTNEAVATAPIQLEYAYLNYGQVVETKGHYNWSVVDELLDQIASRKHQAILRWHDTYVGKPTGVPAYIKELPDYRETNAKSEGKPTGFPDWSHDEWKSFVMDFFTQFAQRYDRDPRIAFVQVGFGLWAEYHIYDGPMTLGKTFPDKSFQRSFASHLASEFRATPWMISVDAAGDHTPFSEDPTLAKLTFGLFDDSFNHRQHEKENAPNWKTLGLDRWKHAPTGGEFSFFEKKDQREALSPSGPHGTPFAEHATRFHISFMIGDDQPRFQTSEVIRQAGTRCGYRFRISRYAASSISSELEIQNIGIAPIYHDAFPAIDGIRAAQSLKGLLPGETRSFRIEHGASSAAPTIRCDRLVPGQVIEYEADLP